MIGYVYFQIRSDMKKRCLLLLAFLIFSYGSCTKLYRRSLAEYDGAVCSDGTPAGYYHSNAPQNEDFVIYLEGGGYCHDVTLCGWRCAVAPHLCTRPSDDVKEVEGILSDNEAVSGVFSNFHKVYLPYCSGDMYVGRRAASEDTKGYSFSGREVFTAMIDNLRRLSDIGEAKNVVLTGSSAGGAGVAFNCDYLKSLLPQADIWCVVDAAFFYPVSKPATNESSCESIDKVLERGAKLWKSPEVENFQLKGWWENVKQNLFIGMARFDLFGLESFCVGEDNEDRLTKWGNGISLMARDAIHKNQKIGLFMPGCLQHMMLTEDYPFASVPVGPFGLTYSVVLNHWITDKKPIHAMDYCMQELMCNKHCKN